METPTWFAAALLTASLSALAQDAPPPFWSEAWRGWHFYEEPETADPRPSTSVPRPSPTTSHAPRRTVPPELAEFERLQQTLEEARKVAIVKPTEVNVRRYMELEAEVVARASTFADVAQRVAWSNPHLDPTLQGRPVNARALEVFEQQRTTDRTRQIAELGREHVLLFFFRSDCPYCHALAPTLLEFQSRYGLRVEAVSIDGGTLPGFASARRDNGIASALQVKQVPAIYLAQPFTGTITPIGFGVLSEAQLVERIVAVAAADYQTLLPGAARHLGRPIVTPQRSSAAPAHAQVRP